MADLEKASQKAREFRQREEEVLQAALALFLELGEDRVTVEMIAEKVGIGKGTIYKHFETKDEIYLLLMTRYEEEMAQLFQRIEESSEKKEQLAKEFFLFRIKDPKRYMLFDRLEQKLVAARAVPELLDRLHRIRASNAEKLTRIVKARIQEGVLEDVPPYFHVCASWALAHGAVALTQSEFYNKVIEDKEGFIDFLLQTGIRMGNRGQFHRKK
jgi:AcrR family transcriptional regulator